MNAQEEMQAIVEATGECWHEALHRKCICGNSNFLLCPFNPSPTDLNELFRLAEKLGVDYAVNTLGGNVDVLIFNKNNEVIGDADADINQLADVLRKSLVESLEAS